MNRTLKPQKMWIDGRTYEIKRFMKQTDGSLNSSLENTSAETAYEITTDNDKFHTSFKTPSFYYHKIYKFPNFNIKTLARNTKTTITANKLSSRDSNWIISGYNREGIIEAREELHSLMGLLRDQSRAVQFISIPTLSEEIKDNFIKFKEEILKSEVPIKGMDESIFQTPLKLHLTLVVFTLLNETEITEVVNALENYKTWVLNPLIQKSGPLKIRLQGIDCMTSNRKSTHVLYANAKITNETEELTLQKIVNGISDYFYEKGFVCRYEENVKLHMTLINTKYRDQDRGQSKSPEHRRWPKKISFDASAILEKYKDFYFGECDFNSIHLSLISSVDTNGYYKAISVINI